MSANACLCATAVAIEGRAILIEGPPGAGKSSLALALIDRGATLIGDDAVCLRREGSEIWLSEPSRIAGLLEVRGVGLLSYPTTSAPAALILTLCAAPPRLPDMLATRPLEGVAVPVLPFDASASHSALRAELALARHGLPAPLAPSGAAATNKDQVRRKVAL
jgi:hypothetical protein